MVDKGRLPDRLDLSRFVVEPPREAAHGDLSCNAAMIFAKEARSHFVNPRQMAVEIAAALVAYSDVAQAEVAGPGFINISLRPSVWTGVLRSVLASGSDFGRPMQPRTEAPINVEYVSANPTGPLHVGHGRGAVFGDCLANLLIVAGYRVTREYYVNDAGAQVDTLARSAYLRYREAFGEPIGAIPEGLYPGEYLRPVGAALAREYGRSLIDTPESEWLIPVRRAAIAAMMAMIRDDLALLAIRHDVFFSERSLLETANGKNGVDEAIAQLRGQGLIYEGRLPPPKGDIDEDWEDRPQTLFRSTNFGDDMDRPLVKSDGSYTYFASDIAYHLSKIRRGFRTLIDVWGADHGGYVKRVSAAVAALSGAQAELDVKICQLVKLLRQGAPVKMSKRAGDFVTLREVVEEVGRDPVRFMMMYRKNDATLEFDLARVIEQSRDNPVFYVQYAHARGCSVLRQAVAAWPGLDCRPAALAAARLELLTDPGERSLIKLIAQYPRLIELASAQHEPHRVAFYLHDLASLFHSHWNHGKDLPQLRFVNETDRDLTCARLALVFSLTSVLASGLAILGVSAPDEMR
jgi:arginyl-tRNA synthetase